VDSADDWGRGQQWVAPMLDAAGFVFNFAGFDSFGRTHAL
jgi:hypothetical protein